MTVRVAGVFGYNNRLSFELLKSETSPISDIKLSSSLLFRNYNYFHLTARISAKIMAILSFIILNK